MKQHSLLLLIFLLTSCAVGPDYKRPLAPTQQCYKEFCKAPKGFKLAKPLDACNRGEWWKIFNDTKLNQLEQKLGQENQSIINAYQNYKQARALVDEARAAYYPTLDVTLTGSRQTAGSGTTSFVSSPGGTVSTASGAISGVNSPVTSSHSWFFDANWEPDIWGAVRRNVEANASAAQASAALLAVTKLSSQALLAQTYFELRGLDTDQVLLDRIVKDYKKTLQITKNQYASGVVSRADVLQAQSQLETAQAAAINNGIARAQYEHAIAILIGLPPACFCLPPNPLRASPPPMPLDVPCMLLERRPDIAQAERLMAQANAQIGVAISAYFPTISLFATASQSAHGLNFFDIPAIGWSYGFQLAETLFDGGLRSATIKAARAGYYASVANYRQVVLTAFQSVEDSLVQARLLKEQQVVVDKAAKDANEALTIILNQYKSGTVAYSSVLTAQITAYNAEKTAADLIYLRMTTAVALVKALGGGWDVDSITCAGGDCCFCNRFM